MGTVIQTDEAQADLLRIWLFIAAESIEGADKLVDSVNESCQMLADKPMAGRTRDDLADGMRSFAAGKYVIFYLPARGGILVLRVLHGAQDAYRQF